MNHPDNLKYTKTDEWIRVEGDECVIGITDYAQDQLGDIVYVEMTQDAGQSISAHDKIGDIESVKATSELLSPISGEVVRVNEVLKDSPEVINDSPYEQGWLLVVKLSNKAELDQLLSSEEYLKYLEGR
ncbi:glycine cleavage system protein GcvH [Ktedonosporobacter rubrisoli]|uniref:glycine cleavage system protein GcvH n=1 Tax=Ktedonosporobacter rubrisoli TaxID=2509675 RepID=UPI0013EE7377